MRAHRCSRYSASQRQAQDDEKKIARHHMVEAPASHGPPQVVRASQRAIQGWRQGKGRRFAARRFTALSATAMHFNHTYVWYAANLLGRYTKKRVGPREVCLRGRSWGARLCTIRSRATGTRRRRGSSLELPLATMSRPNPGVGCVQVSDFAFLLP